jgi:hypothetical protein
MIDGANPLLIVLNGVPGSGKTYFQEYLVREWWFEKQIVRGITLTTTSDLQGNGFYYAPANSVYSKSYERVLREFMKQQKQNPVPCYIYFNDMIGALNWKSKTLLHLLTCFRTYNARVIIDTQSTKLIPPHIRSAAMYSVIFEMSQQDQLKALYESYGVGFETFPAFRKYLREKTGDYRFVLYKRMPKKGEPRYQVCLAPSVIPPWKMDFC